MRVVAAVLALSAAAHAQEAPPAPPEPPARTPFAGDASALAEGRENVSLREIGRSRGGRPLALVTVLPRGGREEEVVWSALLVARLSGARDTDDARLALDVAAFLADTDGLLPPGCAVHVLADASPDATAWAQGVRRRPGNDLAVDEDQDGDADEDGPDDVDGDGAVTWMRFPDPAGDWSAASNDKGEPTFEKADAAKGRQPTHRVVLEGRDDDGDGAWNEDAAGGVDVARNFTWRFEEHVPLAGRWGSSEPESRALLDLALADERIAVVYELGDAESVHAMPGWGGAWTQLPDADVALLNGLRGSHAAGAKAPREAAAPGSGSLGVTTIHHLGRVWFGRRPLGTLTPRTSPSLVKEWRPFALGGLPEGTELGTPAPPANAEDYDVARETESIARFLGACAAGRARLEFRGTETSGADGVLSLTTRLVNLGRLPTHTQRGADAKARRPVNVRVRLPAGATLVAGKPLVQVERIAGGAQTEPLLYVVRGAKGAKVLVEATSPDCGTTTLEAVIP